MSALRRGHNLSDTTVPQKSLEFEGSPHLRWYYCTNTDVRCSSVILLFVIVGPVFCAAIRPSIARPVVLLAPSRPPVSLASPSTIRQSFRPCIRRSNRPTVRPLIYLAIRPSACPSIHQSVHPCILQSVRSYLRPSGCPSVRRAIHPVTNPNKRQFQFKYKVHRMENNLVKTDRCINPLTAVGRICGWRHRLN